ncbi:Hypothetical protein NTJ_11585 [Nesidiocoris tenuis]|nr:Hypothetical protein NTJ_11585 [Nesidiocoris tenuis]
MSRISILCASFLIVVFIVCASCQSNLKPPITGYKRGYKDRVEYITARIHASDLDKGTPPSAKSRAYAKLMSGGNAADDAGHLVAQRLGGTGRETYNIVPQNRKVNRGTWRTKVEAPIYDDVKKGNVVIYQVWPQYADSRATRPYRLTYVAKRPDGTIVLPMNSMDNPLPAPAG